MSQPGPQAPSPSVGPQVAPQGFSGKGFDAKQFGSKCYFGTLVGLTCGGCFGTMTGYTNLKTQRPLLVAPVDKLKSVAKHAAETAGKFGFFYTVYQGTKYCTAVARGGQDDPFNALAGIVAGFIPLGKTTHFRHNMPYAVILVGMDVYHDNPDMFS